jgi:hypothetical protein
MIFKTVVKIDDFFGLNLNDVHNNKKAQNHGKNCLDQVDHDEVASGHGLSGLERCSGTALK